MAPTARSHDYDVKYTFGTAPLQQYLIELPGGRVQALAIAWDTRPRAEGGQRWFHLYPGQNVTHRDELHWTGHSQNWNYMCAECHSTGVRKNYDPTTRRYSTSYAEVERRLRGLPRARARVTSRGQRSGRRAAPRRPHQGARHRAGRAQGSHVDDRRGNGQCAADPARRPAREVETCGRCHARRGQFAETTCTARPLGDTHRVALLEDRLYYPDGQIRDEVYEYGSFLQSKMYHRGVTCTDCHDPHSRQASRARAPGVPRLPCGARSTQAATHHFHPTGSRGADCVGCHMPTTTYMVVDPRHDHSFRVPRPDLSVKLGVPNACTRCHADRPAEWAAKQVETWYGRAPRGYQRYAEALDTAAIGGAGAAELLQAVARDGDQPAIARATALARLGSVAGPGGSRGRPRGAEGRQPACAARGGARPGGR